MSHEHNYEMIAHPVVTSEAGQAGIRAVEIRRCTLCTAEMVFVETKKGWIKLFNDNGQTEQDILLA